MDGNGDPISLAAQISHAKDLLGNVWRQSNVGSDAWPPALLDRMRRLCQQLSVSRDQALVSALLEASDGTARLLSMRPPPLQTECLLLATRVLAAATAAELDVDVEPLLDILLAEVYSPPPPLVDKLAGAARAAALLGALDQLLQCDHEAHRARAGELLGAGRLYMFFGLAGWEEMAPRPLYPVPQTPHDAPTAAPEAGRTENGRAIRSSTGKKVRRRKPNERKSIELPPGSHPGEEPDERPPRSWLLAESSDSDAGGPDGRLRAAQVRVRQAALVLLHSVVRFNDKRHMLGFWPSLVPDTPHVPARTLLTVVLQDPAARCRLCAASVLREMLDSSRFFLTGVDDRSSSGPAPFTPYSVTMACIVKELHRGLLLAALSEKSPLTLGSVLRALATLVANAPYHRLQPGLLTKVSRHVRAFLAHRDFDVKTAALSVLINVVSIHEPLPEVLQLLRAPALVDEVPSDDRGTESSAASADEAPPRTDGGEELEFYDDEFDDDTGDGTGDAPGGAAPGQTPVRSWLWVRCRGFVLRKRIAPLPGAVSPFFYPTPVRLQAMRTLCALTKNYLAAVSDCLPEVSALVDVCMRDEDVAVRLHGARLLECVGDAAAPSPGAAGYDLWMAALTGPLPAMFAPDQKRFVRAAACHALSTIGAGVFERLPRDKQLLCVTLVLPLTADEEGTVRSAAVRAAGVFVRLPSLAEDPDYLLQTAEAACAAATARHEQLPVRVNAIWTLANLTDTLVQRPPDWQPLSITVLESMTTVALRAAEDSDKVKVNAVRALGNLVRHFSAEALADPRVSSLIPRCVDALIRCMTTGNSLVHMKVRWNACHAASNVFKNAALPYATAQWRPPLLEALCKLASNYKNFKVRINAALALSAPSKRAVFGDQLPYAWRHLLEALETAQNITDFNEFKHRDTLLRQVCLTLCRVVSLLEPADLAEAADALASHLDTVSAHLARLPSALLPEQSEPLLAAQDNLRLLKQRRAGALSAEQSRAVELLSGAFAAPS
ncbi:HEAT repeat-containing protein 6-like [Amphibalanus amphitrite]|uniref:HEAT repeat-containing protein 6-like n=1 Tax=Amphibalanus amphitrite TaxID=1232801 RepID=UPI001C914B33|nr:HEAT repeat-containing protein 6-like [Amphibalanus amphitrite]